MNDDKRFLRKLKRQIKKTGNRKRRRYLQDVDAPADDFDLGRDRTDVMNERPKQPRHPKQQQAVAQVPPHNPYDCNSQQVRCDNPSCAPLRSPFTSVALPLAFG